MYTPNIFYRAEHHQTARIYTLICCATQALLLWPPNQRRRVRAMVGPKVCDTEGSSWETTAWKIYLSNMTPHSGNIAEWMGGNVEEIMRQSIDGENWCEVLHGWLIVINGGKKKTNTDLKNKQHLSKIT